MSVAERPTGGPAGVAAAPCRLARMEVVHLDAVMALETTLYEFPWTRGNFVDAIAAGYLARRRLDGSGALIGYFVTMPGVEEMHLLNLSVAAAHQGRGHARAMLDALVGACRAAGAHRLWLEVRTGNDRARSLYTRYGFAEVGRRRGYYPAPPPAGREDAVVMILPVEGAA